MDWDDSMAVRTTTARNVWAEERYLRALQTVGRLMTAAELVLNASKAEGFDGHQQREELLKALAQGLIELAQEITSSGETKR